MRDRRGAINRMYVYRGMRLSGWLIWHVSDTVPILRVHCLSIKSIIICLLSPAVYLLLEPIPISHLLQIGIVVRGGAMYMCVRASK
jgi:hypothetical protein